ncbi:helix-turn-helix domain-containing protein [Bauldia litoralis]|uniref:helix-turn-helix domain-containing protein n=1 Tax=Bauldia litoralis TaxID=665467 RepID=UPI0032654C13
MRNGRHLKAARTLAGMTQRHLARAAGIHPNAVKYWERQTSRIGGHAVTRMRDALAVAGVTTGEEHDGRRSVAVLRG